MLPSNSSLPPALSPSPDYLPPTPRPVAPNLRAGLLRVGFAAGLVLGPLFVLWIGEASSENLRLLAAHGQRATGKVVVRG